MPLNALGLGVAVTPTVISTGISHYMHRKEHREKPTARLSYHEGLHVVRQFLHYASYFTVEDVQSFTAQWVPSPHWIKVDEDVVPEQYLSSAADAVIEQLGPRGVARVGGKNWWQWRGPTGELKGEWIEVRSDYNARKHNNERCKRIMLYVHGGAYYFGSVDTHRYQLQRHARKLKARIFARSEYRLAPQFPFPCALQDCLAAYLYLLSIHDASEILLAGDSAGGGMVLSMLVTLRDRGLPLPAGAILISPWVDLTHSFPSVVGDGGEDYIPQYGFMQRPSRSWPPPNADDLLAIKQGAADQVVKGKTARDRKKERDIAVKGYDIREKDPSADQGSPPRTYPGNQADVEPSGDSKTLASPSDSLSIAIDGAVVEIKDQIQMYVTNQLMSHPLVSPVLQPSLGGLPPLLILTGGGELLRDEQIYVAHKAADPPAYPPNDTILDEHDPNRETLNKYGPTHVQLQVWDDLCHVAPTLSWTRPAKCMFRSIAQFGAWALARAQNTQIDIVDDEDPSSSSSDGHGPSTDDLAQKTGADGAAVLSVGKAGDPLPPFRNHMIRQRVDCHGVIYPLDPPNLLPALQLSPAQVGAINPVLVKKWLGAKAEWDVRFAKEKLRVQKQRIKEFARGYEGFDGESPPPSSLAGRRAAQGMYAEKRTRKGYGLMLWNFWGSKHDVRTVGRRIKADENDQTRSYTVDTRQDEDTVTTSRPQTDSQVKEHRGEGMSAEPFSDVRTRIVNDVGQATGAAGDMPTQRTSESKNLDDTPSKAGPEQSEPQRPEPQPGHVDGPQVSPTVTSALAGSTSEDSRPSSRQENASTAAVLHARGVIPPITRGSSLGVQYNPASDSRSATASPPQLTLPSDIGGLSDAWSRSVRSLETGDDPHASTMAVVGAPGVIGLGLNPSNLSSGVSSFGRGVPSPDVDGPGFNKEASVLSVDGADGTVSPIGDEGKRSGLSPAPTPDRPITPS